MKRVKQTDAQRRAMFASLYRRGILQPTSVQQINTIQTERTPRSQSMDGRKTSKITFDMDDDIGRSRWANAPQRFDIEGVDSIESAVHPYTESIQGSTLDELQYIYGEQMHEFETNFANLSKSEQDDLKLRIKLTRKQIEFRTNERKAAEKDNGDHIAEVSKEVHEYEVGDVVITSSGKMGSIKNINGKFISMVDVSGDTISTTMDNVKLVRSAPEKKDDFTERFNYEQNQIAELTKGNIELITKKAVTDRFRKAVKDGDLTQEQYQEKVVKGELLNESDYQKVVEINKKIQTIKDKPFFEPKEIQDSRVKNAAELLKWEADHTPKELQPPKEYTESETQNFVWGVPENEAIDKLVGKERDRLTRSVDRQNKDEARLKPLEKKWTTLSRKEQKLPENQELRYEYHSLKKEVAKYKDSARWWQNTINKIDSGEYQKINKDSYHRKYVEEVKHAIKKGKPVPFDVVKQYPEFTKAKNSRERYNKGRHTSFANVSIAVDESKKEMHGVKIKLQNGKPMTDTRADQIINALSQFQGVVGDVTHIMRKENLTISHTSGKHPFLSTAAGLYHPTDKTVTMGMKGVTAHEMAHFIDRTAQEHKDEPKHDYNLLGKAKLEWNGGARQALSLSKRKNKEQLKEARELKVHLGSYWERPEEIFARLVEQYTAYKNQDLSADESYYSNMPYGWYAKTPAYWSKSEFEQLVPELEREIERKIKLAETEA